MPRSEVLRTFVAVDAKGNRYTIEVVQEYAFDRDEFTGFAGWRRSVRRMPRGRPMRIAEPQA